MHLVGFTIEIYCDARPYERQKSNIISNIIDKLKEGSVLGHIKPPIFRNHKYLKTKNQHYT
jgi:hypothetical protein